MIIGIQPDRLGNESYSDKWAEFLTARGVEVRFLNLLAPDALAQAQQCDGVMWRFVHTPQLKQMAQQILYTIEHGLGIPVYPNSATRWHYDEKTAQHYLLQTLQAPTPRSWLFWNRDEALAWAETAPYPVVFKLSVGASGANVVKVNSKEEARRLIRRIFKRGMFSMTLNEYRISPIVPHSIMEMKAIARRWFDSFVYFWSGDYPQLHSVWWRAEHGYAYFQEFVPNNEFDTRVTIVGDRAFCYRRINRPNDFRASGSGNFTVEPALIDKRCIEIAFEVSQRGRFQSMSYDFLFRGNSPVISEISYTTPAWMVHCCPGHWDSQLNWIEGQMWLQEAQAEDFLAELSTRKLVRTQCTLDSSLQNMLNPIAPMEGLPITSAKLA
jgi:glutathione synthase/RimK-type ligase-like ATP-grasp enzyme